MGIARLLTSEFSRKIILSRPKNIIGSRVERSSSTLTAETAFKKHKAYEDIPGPRKYPFIGSYHKFLPTGSWYGFSGLKLLRAMHEEFGDMARMDALLGRNNIVFLMRPDLIEKAYRHESKNPFRIGLGTLAYFRNKVRPEIYESAPGLLVSLGKDWADFRSKVNAPLMQPKTIRAYTTVLEDISQEMIARLRRLRNKNNRITSDFGHEMNLWSLESVASVGLGTRIGCLRDELPKDSLQNKLITAVKDIVYLTNELDFKPSIWGLVTTPNFTKLMNAYNSQVDVAMHYINEALKKKEAKKSEEDQQMSILDKLLAIDKKVAVAMATEMMLGGVDTTANTMLSVLYYLATNPEKQDKLRSHIKDALEKDIARDAIPYNKACIKEAIRLYPATIGTLRTLTRDMQLEGYNIPTGTDLVFAHQFLAVHPDQFSDPDEFLPERWLKEDSDTKGGPHAFSNLPFGFGPRSCVGRRLAELELQLFLAHLITSFSIEWRGPPIAKETTTFNVYLPPYHFILTDL